MDEHEKASGNGVVWVIKTWKEKGVKLWPSECNCLALSLPDTMRAYKQQQREKAVISKDIKFLGLCEL